MLTLGIETTCDETSVALVKEGKILANIVASQEIHTAYGGTFPEFAAREHERLLLPVLCQALKEAKSSLRDIALIAVAAGPGLLGAILIGTTAAKTLAYTLGVPLIGVNHVEAHLYGALLSTSDVPPMPALGLVVSGGHTFLAKVPQIGTWELLSSTVDDAAGEAFDKVASMLGLPYPGGSKVEALAYSGDATAFPFRGGQVKGNPLAFSFSGLKTRVMMTLKVHPERKEDIAASFQRAVVEDLVSKTKKAFALFPDYASLLVGGGVACNETLRKALRAEIPRPVYFPTLKLSLDNAAMIAGLGALKFSKQGGDDFTMPSFPKIPLPTTMDAYGKEKRSQRDH